MRHSLPEAFSVHWNRKISVAELEKIVEDSDHFDNRAFHCLGENCGAPVTLANWFTPETQRKQVRHFRSFNHAPDCKYLIYLQNRQRTVEPGGELSARSIEPDRFDPAEDQEVELLLQLQPDRVADVRNQNYGEVLRSEDRPLRCQHLGQLVRRFRKLSLHGEILGRLVHTRGQLLEYEDLFQLVDGQEAQDQVGLPRIWFGSATIKKVSKGYRVVFEHLLQWGRVAFPPAFFVPEAWLTWQPKYSQENMAVFRESEQYPVRVKVFAMGDLKETRTNGKAFLNIKAYKRSEFWMERLD